MRPSLLVLLRACATESAPPPAVAPSEPSPAAKIDPAAATKLAQPVGLSPSPEETRKVVERAGIAVNLSTLVPSRSLSLEGGNKDVIAERTGVYLADTVLSIRQALKDALVERMERVHAGLDAMGAGLLTTAKDLTERPAGSRRRRSGAGCRCTWRLWARP